MSIEDVTVLAYFFCQRELAECRFAGVRHAIEETWRCCGKLRTVLVVNEISSPISRFLMENLNVTAQIEPSLIPGDIHTMSVDCNSRLHSRFDTQYVLIVQEDGYPLRRGLEEFVGRYDFVGAPYVTDRWWKNWICRCLNCWVQNGGFSLRSKRICEEAARLWTEKYHRLGRSRMSAEDLYYTQFLPLHERRYRRGFRLATNRESIRFSWDAVVPIACPHPLPFGFHRSISLAELRKRGRIR